MLARPEIRRCIECGLAYGAPAFAYHKGILDQGPAYWSDRGILCSPGCSLTHYQRRMAEGTMPMRPPSNPFELEPFRFSRR